MLLLRRLYINNDLLERLCNNLSRLDFWGRLLNYDLRFCFFFNCLYRCWLWLLYHILDSLNLFLYRLFDLYNLYLFFRFWCWHNHNSLILNLRRLSPLHRRRLSLPHHLNRFLSLDQRSDFLFYTSTSQFTHDHFILLNDHNPGSLPDPVVLLHLRELRTRRINLHHTRILANPRLKA